MLRAAIPTVVALLLLLVGTARAGEVVVERYLPVAPEVVLAALERDPELSRDVLWTRVEPDGACDRVDRAVRSPTGTLRMRVRRCATARGLSETLIGSEDFDVYASEWLVVPDGDGALVQLALDLRPSLWLPERLLEAGVRRSAEATLDNLARRLEG